MKLRTVADLFIVMAILFIMAVAAEVFIDDFLHPQSLFTYLLLTALISGLAATAAVEKLGAKVLG